MDEDIKLPSIEDCLKEDYIKTILRINIIMPDGNSLSLAVFEGENPDEKIQNFIKNWYEVTNDDPETYKHFDIEEKCPKCGKPMRCRISNDVAYVWCIDPDCRYQRKS